MSSPPRGSAFLADEAARRAVSAVERLGEGDALIIVPPFAGLDLASLGVHVLQAYAAKAGLRVRVLYASLLLAAELGAGPYRAISEAHHSELCGERFFAGAAHGLPFRAARPATPAAPAAPADDWSTFRWVDMGVDLDEAERLAAVAGAWADAIAAAVARAPFRVIGCSSSFEQTNASLALLQRVKRLRPDALTLLGGANCEAEMGEGLAAVAPYVDHVFSGESEETLVAFLRAVAAGEPRGERVLRGAPCADMDALPAPDYTEFFDQRERALPREHGLLRRRYLPYETSRGCWWGQKHHCTFCGLNSEGMAFREKSPERVLADLDAMAEAHGTRVVYMADTIMPHRYFDGLLPRLAGAPRPFWIFYEQKANLSLADLVALKRAGVSSIQPGIEALSTALLRRMDKGVTARQNVLLLRDARAVGVDLDWNMLWGFPGDERRSYEETLALLPLLAHLQPPEAFYFLSIERFSPYFDRPASHGVSRVRPLSGYREVLPSHADVAAIAYHFRADYECGALSSRPLIQAIADGIDAWRARWAREPPTLRIGRFGGCFVAIDTRGLPGADDAHVLDRAEAAAALSARPYAPSPLVDAALERRLGAVIDGWYVPLATAAPALLVELDREVPRPAARRGRLPVIAAGPGSSGGASSPAMND